MCSFGIDVGVVGFGVEGGLLPRLRLGLIAFWWCRGTIGARIARLHALYGDAVAVIRANAGRELPHD